MIAARQRGRAAAAFLLLTACATQTASSADKVFINEPGSLVRVGQTAFVVDVDGLPRIHDFGLSGGFVSASTGASNVATLIAGTASGNLLVMSSKAILANGINGQIERTKLGVRIATPAGYGKTGEPCRSQASSFAVPTDQELKWEFDLQFGSHARGEAWELTTHGKDPALIWQVKAPDLQPALAMIVDTDPSDATKLQLHWSEKAGKATHVRRMGQTGGISPNRRVRVVIRAVLDEREGHDGGKGYMQVYVDDRPVVHYVGPTLSAVASLPHQWFFGVYRYLTICPSSLARVTYWRQARLLLASGAGLASIRRPPRGPANE